ncbi:putative duf221-domain-containing protein [Phaeoacremonium minimum UCRPA7]|uniref:Putative duf221-domain-containing protein n=1 Tax=Phaeoacremonium minimum (strain UCR-PA7) TaxID=1286976 RepID=R8BCX2_PHAM7|nr:putative duf221-domain-containing protein [Phaeoacremonium minimum UCRPA7]EON97141.1 putative duf221-domain-containing protein [Phaeoacremonium minimum UCRPA7]
MDVLSKSKECEGGDKFVKPGTKDTQVQLVISLALGISAFLAFCILRPRWKSLYAARRRRMDPTIALPALPDTFFGWIPALYRVTEEQVLASAGLDAFVFLAFFKLSIKLFAVLFFFAAVVLEPINIHFVPEGPKRGDEELSALSFFRLPEPRPYRYLEYNPLMTDDGPGDDNSWKWDMGYLWAYLVFTYFFSLLTLRFMDQETFRVIKVRQDYLGTQSTITDRTFRLSGMPEVLRSEEKIKELVEKLEIGKVESVTLCRNWKELDDLMEERTAILHKLEETWSVYLGQNPLESIERAQRRAETANDGDEPNDDGDEADEAENGRLLRGPTSHQLTERPRPQTRMWYGFLRLQSQKTDAIDYYEEKLRRLDEKIRAARKKSYPAVDQAFVTMDSIAACQMATQALVDPRPGQLLTKLAPSPSDIVWRNTYASKNSRRVKSWLITIFVSILSIVWLIPVASLAGLLSICTIKKVWPELAASLKRHDITRALVQTGLPTIVVSLLNVAVPYVYDYLSNNQGLISQGDVELSIISKNFFFTFFNIFLVFTVFGAATQIWTVLRDSLKDTTYIAYQLAMKIQQLNNFYLNFIMLQGLGLFPFRLLEFGSVSLYPINRMGAKTPRDFAQLVAPPTFSYGFYLPTALLVFILCLEYSVLPGGYLVLLLGLVYFTLGYFTYKYQLLYAMDQPQHATGGAWRIICYRIIVGLIVFQLTMAGYLGLAKAFFEAFLIAPLLLGTIYYSYYWKRQFEPLTHYLSLRSIRRDVDEDGENVVLDEDFGGPGRVPHELLRRGSTIDEDREKGLKFVNPSLVVPLEQPWIYQDPPPLVTGDRDDDEVGNGGQAGEQGQANSGNNGSTSSSFSLGDTHIWREGGGDNNV